MHRIPEQLTTRAPTRFGYHSEKPNALASRYGAEAAPELRLRIGVAEHVTPCSNAAPEAEPKKPPNQSGQ